MYPTSPRETLGITAVHIWQKAGELDCASAEEQDEFLEKHAVAVVIGIQDIWYVYMGYLPKELSQSMGAGWNCRAVKRFHSPALAAGLWTLVAGEQDSGRRSRWIPLIVQRAGL